MIENKLEHNEEPKVRALVEERGGVVLDHLSKVDSEHVIRLVVKAEPPADSEFLSLLRISEFFCFI